MKEIIPYRFHWKSTCRVVQQTVAFPQREGIFNLRGNAAANLINNLRS